MNNEWQAWRYWCKYKTATDNLLRLRNAEVEDCGMAVPHRRLNARQSRRERHWHGVAQRWMDKYWEAL